MRGSLFTALLAVSLMASGAEATACSVHPYLNAEGVRDRADLIFIGKAIRSHWDVTKPDERIPDAPGELVSTLFEIRETLKGEAGERIEIVHLFPLGGNCGVIFAPNQTALVLATCQDGVCSTDIITLGNHLTDEDRKKLVSLLNVDEPRPFEDGQ